MESNGTIYRYDAPPEKTELFAQCGDISFFRTSYPHWFVTKKKNLEGLPYRFGLRGCGRADRDPTSKLFYPNTTGLTLLPCEDIFMVSLNDSRDPMVLVEPALGKNSDSIDFFDLMAQYLTSDYQVHLFPTIVEDSGSRLFVPTFSHKEPGEDYHKIADLGFQYGFNL